MRRRDIVAVLGGTAWRLAMPAHGGAAVWPSIARAQAQRKRPLVGTLASGTLDQVEGLQLWPSFLEGMRELGLLEGRDFDLVARRAASTDELPQAARDLVQLNPDVILAGASAQRLPPGRQHQRSRSLLQRWETRPRLDCRQTIFAVQAAT